MHRRKTTSNIQAVEQNKHQVLSYLININVKVHHDQHDIYLRLFRRNNESHKLRIALRATWNQRAGPNRPTRVSKHISDVNRSMTNIVMIKAKKRQTMLHEILYRTPKIEQGHTLLWFNNSARMLGTSVMMYICSLLLYCL